MNGSVVSPEWEFVGTQWPEYARGITGWDDPSVGQTMAAAFPAFASAARGSGPVGVYPLAPHLQSDGGHNISMTFGYVVARAAFGRAELSVLDWGGAIGFYSVLAEALMPEVSINYTIKERRHLSDIGSSLLPHVTFFDDDEACFSRDYGLVIASGSLQYGEHWRDILRRLARSAQDWLFVTRLLTVACVPSFVVVQRPSVRGYKTEYFSWAFNRDELINSAEDCGLTLDREFISGTGVVAEGAPEPMSGSGFLFRRTDPGVHRLLEERPVRLVPGR